MIDIKRIKEDPSYVKQALHNKEVDCDEIIDRILDLDVQIRALKTASESRTAQKNRISKENGKLFGMKKGLEKQGKDTAEVDAQIAANRAASLQLDEENASDVAKLDALDAEFRTSLLSLPNLPDPDLKPGGKENNEPLRYYGEPHTF